MDSKHWRKDRRERSRIIAQIGMGEVIKTVEIDKGHPAGPELHRVTTTGLVIINNARTGIMVTILIARENQIRRYFTENEIIPEDTLILAREHERMGYNKK